MEDHRHSFDEAGPARELYVFGVRSEAEARNIAVREQLVSRTAEAVADTEVPYDAWRVYVPKPKVRAPRITGARQSLEEMGNSSLIRRPVRTLAVGVGLGVFGGLVPFVLLMMLVSLVLGGSIHFGNGY